MFLEYSKKMGIYYIVDECRQSGNIFNNKRLDVLDKNTDLECTFF